MNLGRIKTSCFVIAGVILIGWMIPNIFALELSAVGLLILLFGAFLISLPFLQLFFQRFPARKIKLLARGGYILLALSVVVMAGMTAMMLNSASKDHQAPADSAVIVLGAGLRGNQPGELLQSRLDTALGYLKSHPDSICVVTGGYYGKYPQGSVMKNYLISKGVSPQRIRTDDKAANTYENFKYSRTLLGSQKNVVVVTDSFHQMRSKYLAKKFGFTPYSLCSPTPLRHIPDAWVREYGAIIKNNLLY